MCNEFQASCLFTPGYKNKKQMLSPENSFLRSTFLCPERSPSFPIEVPWSLWGYPGASKKNWEPFGGNPGASRGYPGTSGGVFSSPEVPG